MPRVIVRGRRRTRWASARPIRPRSRSRTCASPRTTCWATWGRGSCTCGTFPSRNCFATQRSPRSMKAPAKSNGSSSPAASIPDPSARPASRQIYVGADHAGFQLKQKLVDELTRLGYEPVDVGPKALDPADDYPDYGRPVAEAASRGLAPPGAPTSGTGLGLSDLAT